MAVLIQALERVSVTTGVTTHGDVREQINAAVDRANSNFTSLKLAVDALQSGGGGGSGYGVASLTMEPATATGLRIVMVVNSSAGVATSYLTFPLATSSTAGMMSAADKARLDSLSGGGGGVPSNTIVSGSETSVGSSVFYLRLRQADGGFDDVEFGMARAGYAGLMSAEDKAALDGLSGGVTGMTMTRSNSIVTLTLAKADGSSAAVQLPFATAMSAGVMTAADKEKLDGLSGGVDVGNTGLLKDITLGASSSANVTLTVTRDTTPSASRSLTLLPATTLAAGVMSAADKSALEAAKNVQAKVESLPDNAVYGVNETVYMTTTEGLLQFQLNGTAGAKTVNVTLPAATINAAGLMSGADKRTLDTLNSSRKAAVATLAAQPAAMAAGDDVAALRARVDALEAALRALLGLND